MPGSVAFVPPRFGREVVGGSEAVTREIARGLSERGWSVEVLTTCAVDHYSWANDLPEGTTDEDGVVVRRFPTVHRMLRAGLRAQKAIQHEVLPPSDEQWTWVSWRFRVPELFSYLLDHSGRFDAVVFSPYMFWTTTACLAAVEGNAVVMPCLHDETYARLEVMRPVLAEPASVWFLSEPEHDLAHRLGKVSDHHKVIGAGVAVPDSYDPEGFRSRHGITRPFLLYAGRREQGKGWEWLLNVYTAAVGEHGLDLDLVTIGVGEVVAPPGMSGRVIDLGFLDDHERNSAFAAATAYLQPSRMESFSRTVMEAWLAGTPVLVVEGSEVVSWHCQRSGGGFVFEGAEDLASIASMLAGDRDRAKEAADNGKRYVLDNYTWPTVLERIEEDLTWVAARGTK